MGPVRSAPGSLSSYKERAISGPLWVIGNTHPILGRRIGGTRRGHAPGAAAGLGLGRAQADALAEPTHQGVAELVAQHSGCATCCRAPSVALSRICCVVEDSGMSVHIPSKLSLAQPARVPWARMESPLTAWERQVGCTASRVESRSSSGPHEECRLLGSSP